MRWREPSGRRDRGKGSTDDGGTGYLPTFPNLDDGLRSGRSVRDGYMRGWGIQFGTTRDDVRADPLYQKALKLARRRSVVSEDNRINLYLICRFFLPRLAPGHIVEFGAYKGGNALFMACVAAEVLPQTRVYAVDTYAGIPDADTSIDAHSAGDFKDVDLPELRQFSRPRYHERRVRRGPLRGLGASRPIPYRQGLARAHRQRHLHVGRLRLRQRAAAYGARRLHGLRRRDRVELSWRHRGCRVAGDPEGWLELRADLAALRFRAFPGADGNP